MRALLLATDWTLSNLMLGVSALKGGLHITSPETMFSNTVEGWAARQSLAQRRGESGALGHLGFFFKNPLGCDTHDLAVQHARLVEHARRTA